MAHAPYKRIYKGKELPDNPRIPWASHKRLEKIKASRDRRMKIRAGHLKLPEVKLRRKLARAHAYHTRILTHKQRAAIAMLSDFHRKYPREFIAVTCGVALSTIRRWRNDPLFIQELDKEITRRRNALRPEAFRHMFRAVRKGDLETIFKYLKMTGDFTDKIEITEKTIEDQPEHLLDQEIQQLQNELGYEVESDE